MSVLSLEGSIAAGKGKGSLSLEQCRKRVEKAFESDKLAGVLLRYGGNFNQNQNKNAPDFSQDQLTRWFCCTGSMKM